MLGNLIRLFAIVALMATMAGRVSAGGMATVHLDEMPTNVTVGVPVEIGFTVMQHDVSPVNVDSAYVSATHRESGDTVDALGVQSGATGHYVAELTFPAAGSWKWSITPAPFAGTSFESIMVLGAGASSNANSSEPATHPVTIDIGTCPESGTALFKLSNVAQGTAMLDAKPVSNIGTIGSAGEPVSISSSTVPITIAELTSSPHAINIHKSDKDNGTSVACGAIGGTMWNGELIVGLQQVNNSGQVGIATLGENETGTTVSIYMLTTKVPASAQTLGKTVEVTIVGHKGSWTYSPPLIEIEAGTTVVWRNTTDVSHTVTGKDLAFEDSGPFGNGESFEQTFTTPGEFDYYCSPHPFMTGRVTVT